jgi:signal transduction histidine kinase/DNA-binding response OmpR family regulator
MDFLDQLMESIGIVLNTIEANSRTEDLLKQSQSLANELQSQQDQLQRTNEELAEKARQLVQQNTEIEQRRDEVEAAKTLVEEKADQLAITSRYKSEFLANMSHELRTPLNSLLILAQELAANPDGNLLAKQIEYATIIRSSGTDLLKLINDILDLSKIESGTVTLDIADWPVQELKPMLERTFRHVAEATKLAFTIDLRPGLPETIPTDAQRLQQILNNLLSNAFKFTEKGRVEFIAQVATSGWNAHNEVLNSASKVVAFSVVDSGIGIPESKQHSIFESFAQADGTTSRKYGGTGLGLSICRELTRLLGGEIQLQSEPGVGSVFSVYLPVAAAAHALHVLPGAGGRTNGRPDGSPRTSLVTVGAGVGLGPGWHVEAAQPAVEQPDEPQKTVLVVEDDPVQRQHLVELMASVDARTIAAGTGEEALALLEDQKFDCLVLDLGLPGMSGWEVIDHVRGHKALRSLPLLVYTARDLTKKEEVKLGRATKTIVIKEVRSPERLMDEVKAVLEDPSAAMASLQPGSNGGSESHDSSLAGKRVLVVDDDIRNIFALTAMLERHQMDVTAVDSGQEAIDALAAERGNFDVALVDVMMPEMDGYVTMTRMREFQSFKDRPIIALTAKAMKGDREKCIEAGASDYIAKPVNTPELLAMLRTWLTP